MVQLDPNAPSLPTGQIGGIQDKQSTDSVFQGWKAQHKIEKATGTGVLVYLLRKVALVVSFILSIPLIPFVLLYNLGVALKEKYTISYQPKAPLTAIREMKLREEKDKLQTMKNVISDFEEIRILSPEKGAEKLTANVENLLGDPNKLEQNRGARQILRALSRQKSFHPKWIEALNDPDVLQALSFVGETSPDGFNEIIKKKYPNLNIADIQSLNWKQLSRKVRKKTIAPEKIKEEVKKFKTSLKELLTILQNEKTTDFTSTNQKLIAALRKALSSPVYQALKENPTEPSVKFLHRLASDTWNKAPSMDAYRDVGKNIMHNTNIVEGQLDGGLLADHLDESHKKMASMHYTAHGLFGQIVYAITHPIQTLKGLAGEGGTLRHIPGAVGLDVYDPHGLSNNPSLQGVTTFKLNNGGKAKVHNCYGGSPTIGDHKISPEFEAVLQAAENNQLAPEGFRDENIPMFVIYNNLQNLDKKDGEGPRSRTIMLSNEKYPLSFRGTTFAKDSHLYLMKTNDSVVWKGEPSKFGQKMQAQLERSFQKGETGHGFYFHGSLEEWQSIFKKVIENANAHFENLRENKKEVYDRLKGRGLQGAYQEYVYSLLNGVMEAKAIKTLSDRGIQNSTIMAITACKENIDRGGMENTKYLYTRLDDKTEDKSSLIVGAMYCRALSTRDRLPLETRIPQVLDFMRTTSPQTFRENQMTLFAGLAADLDYPVIESQQYCPHLIV